MGTSSRSITNHSPIKDYILLEDNIEWEVQQLQIHRSGKPSYMPVKKPVNMADGINPRVFYGQIKLSLGGVAHLDRLLGCTATIGVCVADGQYTPLGGWTVQWHQPSRNHLEDSYRYCQP